MTDHKSKFYYKNKWCKGHKTCSSRFCIIFWLMDNQQESGCTQKHSVRLLLNNVNFFYIPSLPDAGLRCGEIRVIVSRSEHCEFESYPGQIFLQTFSLMEWYGCKMENWQPLYIIGIFQPLSSESYNHIIGILQPYHCNKTLISECVYY